MSAAAEILRAIGRHARLRGSKGTYRIIHSIGQGGNGTVFLACGEKGPLTGNLCAIKIFHGDDGKRKRRFLLETEIGQKLDHRSLVQVIDDGNHLEQPFSVLEYWPDTLSLAIRRGTLSAVAKIAYALQMLSALAYLAELGYVHRDIKPDNVLVRGPNCALADFGLLRKVEKSVTSNAGVQEGIDEALGDLEHTMVASEMGEARMPRCYRTPELVKAMVDENYVTPCSSDVFQLGLVLAEMFFGVNPQAAPLKKADGKYDLASPLKMETLPMMNQGIHARIRESIASMINKDASARPSCAALLDDWGGIFSEACDRSIDLDQRLIVHW